MNDKAVKALIEWASRRWDALGDQAEKAREVQAQKVFSVLAKLPHSVC